MLSIAFEMFCQMLQLDQIHACSSGTTGKRHVVGSVGRLVEILQIYINWPDKLCCVPADSGWQKCRLKWDRWDGRNLLYLTQQRSKNILLSRTKKRWEFFLIQSLLHPPIKYQLVFNTTKNELFKDKIIRQSSTQTHICHDM